jgi:TetR/AcrR family transcriptional repressor of nem operon
MLTVKQPRALQTRDRILREATRLFAARGYHDTKLDEILQAAGVTTGAFFHHFRGKEDLGFAVLDWYLEQRGRELDAVEQALYPDGSADPLERLFQRLDATEERFCRRARRKQGGCIFGNLSTALCETHDGFRRRLADCFEAMAMDFKPRLDAVARQHAPRRRIDTLGLARYLVAVLEGSIILARANQDAPIIGRHFQLLKEHLRQVFGA